MDPSVKMVHLKLAYLEFMKSSNLSSCRRSCAPNRSTSGLLDPTNDSFRQNSSFSTFLPNPSATPAAPPLPPFGPTPRSRPPSVRREPEDDPGLTFSFNSMLLGSLGDTYRPVRSPGSGLGSPEANPSDPRPRAPGRRSSVTMADPAAEVLGLGLGDGGSQLWAASRKRSGLERAS
eukprot:TRINITY_DN4537_c0_g1_i1.p2 TRINITY_DN4537_c0_g1~~TRINITY_DN4537_c0_g1_i1.p2  ORF type:complete len:176 (+),score=27.40 TRINITY_DN4537_c0_g1_i1:448-975(+)